ncbi:MAG: MBL fold metallo-hydrolase [Pseudomonadota bacterium]
MIGLPLHLEIEQKEPGFEGFFGAWVVPGEVCLVVDVGPANSADRLLAALERERVDRIDYVLLTHIHIDHSGGLAAVLDRYPMARAICHEAGLRHVADPAKLWEGSRQVLKNLAEQYGRPGDVDPGKLIPHIANPVPGLEILETPGHAPHHLSFTWQGRLFSGEAGGNLLRAGDRKYLRPATPPRFFLQTALDSVDKLLALPDQPIYYAHFEQADSSRTMLRRFRDQLLRWRDIIAAASSGDGPPAETEDRCVRALLDQDPELSGVPGLPAAARKRELTFMANSVRGYLGFLSEISGS